MNILVTGATGFIGSYLVKKLVDMSYNVVALDNLSCSSSENIYFVKSLGIDLKVADIRDNNNIRSLFEKYRFDLVIHLASLISVDESIEHPDKYFDVNTRGTAILIKHAIKKNVSRFIYISSAAVYGVPEKLPINEDHPLNPISPYGISKLAGEQLVRIYSMVDQGFKHVILRLFNVYGPRQNVNSPYNGVITRFIYRVLNDQPPIIYGDGLQVRDFIYVEDVVEAIIQGIKTKHVNKTYNIGSGKPVRILDLAEKS